MAVNPMQRKTRNSFLLGVIITAIIFLVIVALLFMQLMNEKKEKQEIIGRKTNVYVVNQDVKSGQVLTEDMFTKIEVDSAAIPSNATANADVVSTWFLQTKDGQMVNRDEEGLYITEVDAQTQREKEVRIYEEETTGSLYTLKTNATTKEQEKQYLELNNVPILAKVNMSKNTVITPSLVVQSDTPVTDDLRKQEYNMIILPIDLMTDDYVDIRLMMPNGQDFIVVSKAQVTVPMNEDGTYVADTITMNLREDEILSLSSAIVEAYGVLGAKLYATRYVEPGMQNAVSPTYTPNSETTALINSNPNIVNKAMQELATRYSESAKNIRNQYIQSEINSQENYKENIQENTQEDVTNSLSARQLYLQTLGY